MNITIIGGGNMGGAIALGLAQRNSPNAMRITVSDKNEETLETLRKFNTGLYTLTDNVSAVKNADIVILAVKPWIAESVIAEIRGKMDFTRQWFVSVVSGLNFEQLSGMLDVHGETKPVLFRVIPNTAIRIGESMTVIASCNAAKEQQSLVLGIFGGLGKVMPIEERFMAAATSLGSCGTAFAMRYVRAAMEAGVEMGLYSHEAQEIVAQALKGAAELLLAGGSHPETEIDKVTTPGGSTIKGLNAMEEAGFSNAVIKGHKAVIK